MYFNKNSIYGSTNSTARQLKKQLSKQLQLNLNNQSDSAQFIVRQGDIRDLYRSQNSTSSFVSMENSIQNIKVLAGGDSPADTKRSQIVPNLQEPSFAEKTKSLEEVVRGHKNITRVYSQMPSNPLNHQRSIDLNLKQVQTTEQAKKKKLNLMSLSPSQRDLMSIVKDLGSTKSSNFTKRQRQQELPSLNKGSSINLKNLKGKLPGPAEGTRKSMRLLGKTMLSSIQSKSGSNSLRSSLPNPVRVDEDGRKKVHPEFRMVQVKRMVSHYFNS